MYEPEYYDADRWGVFSDNYEEKKKKSKVQLKYYAGEELVTAYSENIPYLWGNILPKSGLVCLAGESDCGKSAFLRQLAIFNCLNNFGTFLGLNFENNKWHKRALYISTEDNQAYFAATLRKQCKDFRIEPRHLSELKVIFESDNIIEKIEMFQKTHHTNLIIIDCLNDILPTQATSAVAIRKFLSRLQRIAEDHQCLIIMTHHTNKYAHNRRPSKYNLIGSPALEAKCRTVIELRTDPFQRNFKHLCVVKGNYTPDGEKNKSYMLEFTPNLTFKNTYRRVDIDTLTLMPDYIADRVEKYNRLRNGGVKGDELAKAMGFASRGSLSVWAKKYIKNNTKPSEPQPTPDLKDPKDSKDSIDSPDPQPTPDPKDPNIPKDSMDSKDPKDSPDSHPSPDPKDPNIPKDSIVPEDSPSPSNTSTSPKKPRINPFDILYPL